MNSILVSRLTRLEKHTLLGNPYAHLSDEDLEARLMAVTDDIQRRVGMTASEYASELQALIDAGEAPLEGSTNQDVQGFIASLQTVATMRSAYVQ